MKLMELSDEVFRIGSIRRRQVQILAGVILFALGNILFAFPNQISAGGITGLSMLLNQTLGWNVGFLYFLLNAPLFLAAWRLSKQLFLQSLGSMILCSVLIGLMEPLTVFIGIRSIWTGSVAGGIVMGAGLGIMGAANASLGGGSLTGKMLEAKWGIPFSISTFIFDASIYPLFYLFLGADKMWFSLLLTLFSACGIYFTGRIGGAKPAKKIKR
jgi:Uncharacterized conserved protein